MNEWMNESINLSVGFHCSSPSAATPLCSAWDRRRASTSSGETNVSWRISGLRGPTHHCAEGANTGNEHPCLTCFRILYIKKRRLMILWQKNVPFQPFFPLLHIWMQYLQQREFSYCLLRFIRVQKDFGPTQLCVVLPKCLQSGDVLWNVLVSSRSSTSARRANTFAASYCVYSPSHFGAWSSDGCCSTVAALCSSSSFWPYLWVEETSSPPDAPCGLVHFQLCPTCPATCSSLFSTSFQTLAVKLLSISHSSGSADVFLTRRRDIWWGCISVKQ